MSVSNEVWEGPAMIEHAEKGNLEKMRFFLENLNPKGNINIRGMWNMTMLHAAAGAGNLDAVEFLLKRTPKPDIEAKTDKGMTPLHTAAGKGECSVVSALIGAGALVNAQTKTKATPLIWAVANDQIDAATLLMERGAIATMADKDGCTVLHKACERSHLEMVKLLVSYGASIDDKNKEGKIPMDCCDTKLPDGNKCKGLMFQVALVREEETYGSGASGFSVAKKMQATMTSKFRETAEELEVTRRKRVRDLARALEAEEQRKEKEAIDAAQAEEDRLINKELAKQQQKQRDEEFALQRKIEHTLTHEVLKEFTMSADYPLLSRFEALTKEINAQGKNAQARALRKQRDALNYTKKGDGITASDMKFRLTRAEKKIQQQMTMLMAEHVVDLEALEICNHYAQELTKLINQDMTPIVHYTLLSSEHSEGMDDDPGAAPYEPTGEPYPYPRVHIVASEVSRVRAITRRANRLAALKLPVSQKQDNTDNVLTINEALYWATDCSDFSTHTRVTLKLSNDPKILEKQGNVMLRLVGAWQRKYDIEIDEQEAEENDEEGGEVNQGKMVKRPLVCPFLRPVGLFPFGDPGLVGGLRSGISLDYTILAHDFVHMDLDTYVKEARRYYRWDIDAAARRAEQALDVVAAIHSLGFALMDVRPYHFGLVMQAEEANQSIFRNADRALKAQGKFIPFVGSKKEREEMEQKNGKKKVARFEDGRHGKRSAAKANAGEPGSDQSKEGSLVPAHEMELRFLSIDQLLPRGSDVPELINLIDFIQAAQSQKHQAAVAAGTTTADGEGGGDGGEGGSQHVSGTASPLQGQPTPTQPPPSSSAPLRTSFAYMSPELAKRYILIQERKGVNGVFHSKEGDHDSELGLGPGPGLGLGPGLGPGQGENDLTLVKKPRVTWSGKNDVHGPGLGPATGSKLGEGAVDTTIEADPTEHNNHNNSTKYSNKSSGKSSEGGSSADGGNEEDQDDDDKVDDGDVKRDNGGGGGRGGGGSSNSEKEEDDDDKEVTRLEGELNLVAMDMWSVGILLWSFFDLKGFGFIRRCYDLEDHEEDDIIKKLCEMTQLEIDKRVLEHFPGPEYATVRSILKEFLRVKPSSRIKSEELRVISFDTTLSAAADAKTDNKSPDKKQTGGTKNDGGKEGGKKEGPGGATNQGNGDIPAKSIADSILTNTAQKKTPSSSACVCS